LITQALYCLVFITRYLDIFGFNTVWNTVLKTFYILSSLYILLLMMRVYARTREREKAWKLGAASLVGSAVLAPIVMLIFRKKDGIPGWGFKEVSPSPSSNFPATPQSPSWIYRPDLSLGIV
jgi:hypothetical protein